MLPEKLYILRKKSGLSQEQLAEQLQVSRQAVSKWESGTAVPESEKLIAISDYFGVTVDYLLKDGGQAAAEKPQSTAKETPTAAGIVLCMAGVIAMIVWGLICVFRPQASDRMGDASMITIDGNGVFLLICVAAIIAGTTLIVRNQKTGGKKHEENQ